MKTKRDNEGYILFDHSDSPGMPDQMIKSIDTDLPLSMSRQHFEAPCYTCSHCQFVVVLNPLRQRERGWCPKCDKYVCDKCKAVLNQTGECKTWLQIVDEVAEAAIKAELIKEI